MRSCAIINCGTKSSDGDRSLFEVKGEDRQKWISVIAAQQPLIDAKTIYICDLHSDPNDLTKNGKHCRPKKNVLPRIGDHSTPSRDISGAVETDEDFQPNTSSITRTETTRFDPNTTSKMKSISLEEYRRLCKATIDLIKANETIDKLNIIIHKKDAMIQSLKTKLDASKVNSHLSTEQNEVLNHLQHRKKTDHTKYPPAIRKFCLRMKFHSTSAYNELRKFFGKNLPHCRTMQRWLRSADASPGITSLALDIIAQKVQSYEEQGKSLNLCLISDEMSIRRQINYNPRNKQFSGFVTHFNSRDDNANNKLAVAKEVLVFMVVGPDFRLAVAYFLLNGLESIDRAVLTREVLRAVYATGAKIISLTSDGLRANVVVAELLGADFEANKPHFPNPANPKEKIYIIFDPAHMLKLVRKHFAEQQLYYNGDELKWNLLRILAEKQDNDNFELGNKLSNRHINYKIAPMDVRMAVETFSNSVADVLEQLNEDGYEDFLECEATVKFIRLYNNLFDAMNYGEGKKTDERFKRPICASTIVPIRELFVEGKNFIERISIRYIGAKKDKTTPVLKSRSSMGFFGFLHNMTSSLGIHDDYIKNGSLDTFYPFQYSQDHLETYFALIRSSLGENNNPNAQQFAAAYRKLLFCVPHLSAHRTNCNLDLVDILTVSSADQPKQPTQQNSLLNENEIEIGMGFDELLNNTLDLYQQHMCAYLAVSIETRIVRNIETRTISACQDCSKVFEENTKMFDSFVAKKNDIQPCSSTRDLIVICDSVLKLFQSNEHIAFEKMSEAIFKVLDIDRLYALSHFNDHHKAEVNQINSMSMTHKDQFIYAILEEYMHMKSKKIGKRITYEEQGQKIRRKATRNIILAGQ